MIVLFSIWFFVYGEYKVKNDNFYYTDYTTNIKILSGIIIVFSIKLIYTLIGKIYLKVRITLDGIISISGEPEVILSKNEIEKIIYSLPTDRDSMLTFLFDLGEEKGLLIRFQKYGKVNLLFESIKEYSVLNNIEFVELSKVEI